MRISDWSSDVCSSDLQQVIVNLIVNAIHAMPDGGTLKLRTRDMDDDDGKPGVAIDVADSGVGMTLEVMQRIFDPFFTTKRLKGTGLGPIGRASCRERVCP